MKNYSRMWGLTNNAGEHIKQNGLYGDKQSLLISHDLIALRGLEETEEWLQQKSKTVKEMRIIIDNTRESNYFAPIINGVPDPDMIDFGSYDIDKETCKRSIAFYIASTGESIKDDRFNITNEEANALSAVFLLHSDTKRSKKAQKAYNELVAIAEKVFEQNGISIERISVIEV